MKTDPSPAQPPPAPVPFWPTLGAYARPYRGRLAFAMATALVSGVAVALQPVIIKFIVDDGINRPGASADVRLSWAAVFVGVYLALSGFRIVTWRLGYKRFIASLEGILFDIRSRFFRHIQGLCFRFHDQVSSGELFNYIMGSPAGSLKIFLQQFVMGVPNQVLTGAIALCTLACFDWQMTLFVLVIVVAIVTVNRRSHHILKTLSAEFMKQESSVSKYVADMLRGTREIKIHAIEDRVSTTFDGQLERIRDYSQMVTLRQQLEYMKPEGIQYVGYGCVYLFGAFSCIHRGLTVGELFAFISSAGLLIGPIMSLLQLNLVKANAEAGLERIVRILETEASVEEPGIDVRVSVASTEALARDAGTPFVEFRNVTFGYGDAPILRNVSCRLDRGKAIALVGPSGSGKTTFVRLVLRLYDPQQGAILLNGTGLRHYGLRDLRSSFGVVSQDTFLFQATLAENIRVAQPEASPADIKRAMELSYLSECVEGLPDKEHTEVGENAYALSGGQRQRVAIARAVLGNHRHFIFDEATSALDNQSERRIQESMTQLQQGHSMIVIAHRLSTIRHVDRILVFDKGEIVQQGTYEDLAATPGLFAELLRHGL